MHSHTTFILSPIKDILKDVVSACAGIGNGIETYPVCDYIMQSVFIKMTGFQEQKMKCICWEFANNDYDYRYDFTQQKLGECSRYEDKSKIYADLIKQLNNLGIDFSGNLLPNKNLIVPEILEDIKVTFLGTNLSKSVEYDFLRFKDILAISPGHFANDKASLFSDKTLKDIYINHLYRQRNRIAHNTPSYQQNLPTLKSLAIDDIKYENYFVYFSLLILIDTIFIELYKIYLIAIKDRVH